MAFPYHSANLLPRCVGPQPRRINPSVCPLPRSLATTCGISVDFSSSPYLDVSVQAVPHLRLFYSTQVDGVLLRRVSPFGHPGINAYVQLPQAYRSLSRPSSAPDAKAFPLRSYSLDLVGVDFVSLASPHAEKLAHSITPPLRIGPTPLGSDSVLGASRQPLRCPSVLSTSETLVLKYQELCRPQIRFIVVLCYPLFKVHKLLCYLSVACSLVLEIFVVQFSRCTPDLFQGQIEMLIPMNTSIQSCGGGYRTRTGDPLLAKQVLYQLS